MPDAATTEPSARPLASPEDRLLAECRKNLEAARGLLDQILAVKEARTVDNTLVVLNHLLIHLGNALNKASLYANAHPDPKVRAAGETCEQEGIRLSTELSLNRDLYEAVAGVNVDGEPADTQRFAAKTLEELRRAGVDKDEATRKRLKEIEDALTEQTQRFDKNIRDDVRSVKLDPRSLEGLPDDYIKSHPPGEDGKVVITTDYPDFIPFRNYARDADARRQLYRVYLQRGWPANEEVFKTILALRKEKASLLGYKDWADYITGDRMAKSGKVVQDFINKVHRAANRRAKADLAMLLERKRKDDPRAKTIDWTERAYYEELVKRERFSFDSQSVRPYFEFGKVRDGLLAFTSELFEIEYRPVADAAVWHEDVTVYDVYRGEAKLGRIYLDLHPREGKYKHAAQFPLVSGVAGQQLPEGVLVCNFPDPKKAHPALMEHDQVETLFHEFGHLLHHVLGGHQRWVRFSGVATEWDFVEAPSQMLEEWAWDVKSLQAFARHHETGQPIPAELVQKMRAAAEFGKGVDTQHQMFYAALSLETHRLENPRETDLDALTDRLMRKYSPFKPVADTHFYASFGHLSGYSAAYYTYMWSLVIAKDMFSVFAKNGLFDEETARRYRDAVLVPGGSKDAADLVEDFLGRPYDFRAFERWLNRG